MKSEKTYLQHYENIDDLPLYNWDKYSQTSDNNWFLLGYNGKQKKIESEILKELEVNILDQYFKAVNDNSLLVKLRKWDEIEKLKLKYITVLTLLEGFYSGFGDDFDGLSIRAEYINAINSWGYRIPLINSLQGDKEEIEKVYNSIQGLKTKIQIIKDKIQADSQKQSSSLNKQIHIATIALQYPHKINPKDISVSDWIEICKMVEDTAKKN